VSRRTLAWILVVIALGAAMGTWRWWTRPSVDVVGVLIAGGDGGGLPRSEPGQEGFDPEALEAAGEAAFRGDTSELLITRHGHLVYERYERGADSGTLVLGGELSQALLMIAAGIAVTQHGMSMPAPPLDNAALESAIAAASNRSYPQFLSRHVWQPMHAGAGRWTSEGVSARAVDWMRVAELLLHDGRFEGTQVVRAGWIPAELRLVTGAAPEPPGAGTLLTLRGPGATRLWLAPRLDLAILRVAAAPVAGAAVDESLGRTLINTLRDRPSSGGNSLNDLVPGH